MTAMRVWALLFWSGAALGWFGHLVAVFGPSEAGTVRTVGLLVMAASALPMLGALAYRLRARARTGRSLPGDQEGALAGKLRPLVASARVHGIAAALAEGPGEAREPVLGSSGMARALDSKTGFEIGSLTKTFTGILLAPAETRLAEAIALAHEPRRATRAALRGRLFGSKLSESRIGLAWITSPIDDGANVTWHNGGTGGFGTFLGFDRERPWHRPALELDPRRPARSG